MVYLGFNNAHITSASTKTVYLRKFLFSAQNRLELSLEKSAEVRALLYYATCCFKKSKYYPSNKAFEAFHQLLDRNS